MRGLDDGTLFWFRNTRPGIKVPLSLLTEGQRTRLATHIAGGNLRPAQRQGTRLIWEFFNDTDGGWRVTGIRLSKEQQDQLLPPEERQLSQVSFHNVDFHALRDSLRSGVISWQEVIRTFESMPYRPWTTKSWKEMRDIRIGSTCASCATTEGVMVLQHTRQRQPQKPMTLFNKYERSRRRELQRWLVLNPDDKDKLRFYDQTGIGIQVARELLGQMIRYLSMKDTKTLCKSCAYKEDKL